MCHNNIKYRWVLCEKMVSNITVQFLIKKQSIQYIINASIL